MKNDKFYNEFSVQELESRLELKKWIPIGVEKGPCGCDDGDKIY